MWNKLSQVAGLVASEEDDDETKHEGKSASEEKEQLQQQEILIQQLKDLVRENEKRFQEKTKEYDDLASKFQKFKLKSKATISHLSSQVKGKEQAKKEDCDFDDASSTDSSDQSQRGKVILFRRQLEQVKQQLSKREEEFKKLSDEFERKVSDLELQLNEKNVLISSLADAENAKTAQVAVDKSPKKEASSQEMYAQIVYKDSKILELNNQILELEKQIMDLQEHVKEKDEVLQQRNRAVQLMAADMSRKGKSVVDELDETREQMKIMQETFSTTEDDWKVQIEKYASRIAELEKEIVNWDKKHKSSEATAKSLDAARQELSVKNAELQKKMVIIQESASKQCEQFNKEIEGQVEVLNKSLETEKLRAAELQKALDESSSQSDNKVLKARVKERTKFKALERELNELKKAQQDKPQEILELQQKIAELEEEKGSLQLKLMDIEEQVLQLEKLKKENESLKADVENSSTKIHNLEKQISELQVDKENWETRFETLEESYKELKEKFNHSIKEKLDLEDNNKTLAQTKENLGNELKDFKEEYNNLQKSYSEICQEFDELKDQKISFELKSIELEEIRESDEKTKKELLSKIEEMKKSFSMDSKPEIQLETENIQLRDKIQELEDKNNELEAKCQHLSIEIVTLQTSLQQEQAKYSSELESLFSKLNASEQSYKKALEDLNSKSSECDYKNTSIQEMENSMKYLKMELSQLFSCANAKDINECNNYIVQKNEEYAHLKSEHENLARERDNLLLNLQKSRDEEEKYNFKLAKLDSLLEQRDNEITSLELVVQDLKATVLEKDAVIEKGVNELNSLESAFVSIKETIAGKDNEIFKIISQLEENKAAEQMLVEAVKEKTELITKYEGYQESLKQELKALQDSQLVYREKYRSNSESLLGQITDLESELSSKERLIEDLNDSLGKLQADYQSVVGKLEEAKSDISAKENVILNMESSINSKDKSISALHTQSEGLKQATSDKSLEILSIVQKLKEMEICLDEKDEKLSSLNSSMQESVRLFSEKEQELKILKDKNVLLEEEKLHSTLSLTEKDEVHKQILMSKLQLDEDVSKLQNENKSLEETLSDKIQELHLLEETVSEMSILMENPLEAHVAGFLEKIHADNNKLAHLAKQLFQVIEDHKNEKTKLQFQLSEMQVLCDKLQEELKVSSSDVSKWQSQYEELTNKQELMNENLKHSHNNVYELEIQQCYLQKELQEVKDENALLKNNIHSSQQQYLLEITNLNHDIQKNQNELKEAIENYQFLQNENLKLIDMHKMLEATLNEYQVKGKDQVDYYKDKLQSFHDENEQKGKEHAKEKTDLEALVQNLKAENEQLCILTSELKTQINHHQNESNLSESSMSNLQNLISEKDLQISGLSLHLSVLEEKVSDLNDILSQKENEHKLYLDSVEPELKILKNYKENYCTIAKSLKSSNDIDTDISFLESSYVQTEPVEEIAKLSNVVTNNIMSYFLKMQQLTSEHNSVVKELSHLKEENQKLCSQNDALKQYLVSMSDELQNNLKQNGIKFETILSSLTHKIGSLERTEINVSSLSNSYLHQKNYAASLQLSLEKKINDLQAVEESMSKSEEAVRLLTAEKVAREQTLDVISTKYLELTIKLQEATDNYNSINTTLEQQQKNLENYVLENGELRNLVSSKNEEISRLIQEQNKISGTVIPLELELTNSQLSISALEDEIRKLNTQLTENALDSHFLETSNNVSNGLQVEVENLRQELVTSIEEKSLLQQHIEHINLQLHVLLDEKAMLESSVEQMQHKLNELIETNLNLTKASDEFKLLMESNEKRIQDLEVQHSKSVSLFENTCKDVESFKQEKAEFLRKEKDLLEKVDLLEKKYKVIKEIVNRICDIVSQPEDFNSDFDTGALSDDADDQFLIDSFRGLVYIFTENRKEKNSLQNIIETLELKNKELSEVLQTTQEKLCKYQKQDIIKRSDETKEMSIVDVPEQSIELDTNVLQQSSPSDESLINLETENEALKKEVNDYKIKFAKSLSKLKLFKDKNDKLNSELKELKDKNKELESKARNHDKEFQNLVTSIKKENAELSLQLKICTDEKQIIIIQLKERIALLEEENYKIKKELQDYKQSWEQLNVSYELQKEDNQQLRIKLKTALDETELSKSTITELKLELAQFRKDNSHLRLEIEGAKEHSNMLLSDNDTYQNLIEKLTITKSSLEQKLSEAKSNFNAELKALQDKHEQEIKALGSNQTIDTIAYTKLEKECNSVKKFCSEMEHSIQALQQERDSCLRNQSLLEKEKLYLQHQLCEKVEELKIAKAKLDENIQSESYAIETIPDSTNSVPSSSTHVTSQYEMLKEENHALKSEISSLTETLNQAQETFQLLQRDNFEKETELKSLLQDKHQMRETELYVQSGQSNMEYELQQAMTSLHKQGLRCEELSLEVSKLLEERNILRWKLQQCEQTSPEMRGDSSTFTELASIKVDSPSSTSNMDVATLHARLVESEKTCNQLRQANDALDRALSNERDHKKMIEEELGYAKEHILEDAKASDEYQILLGEVNEPEFFAESNFSITRNVRTHTSKLRRWLRGRRNYLWRTVKSRNYRQLVYIFYIFFIHIWLLACVSS